MNTALPNPFLQFVIPSATDRMAAASSFLSPTESAAATRFKLDEGAFMAAIMDDRPAFIASPSAAYLDMLMDLAVA